jgi:putative endopeptidase
MTKPQTPTTMTSLHTGVRPQDDFYTYVNAKWIADNPIPESESRWGMFSVLDDESKHAMLKIYEDLQDKTFSKGTVQQQARDFYYSGMHYDEYEAVHLQQLKDIYSDIDSVQNIRDISRVIGGLHATDNYCFWGGYVEPDLKNGKEHSLYFYQSGLTLPNRDYYLQDDEKMQSIRNKYETFAKKVYGYFPALAASESEFWDQLITVERALAGVSRSAADLRDVEKNYNRVTLKELKDTYTGIDWDAYAAALGWKADDKISVNQPEFLASVNKMFTEQPLDITRLYLKWCVTMQHLNKISVRFSELQFEFFGRVLGGATEMKPLWKRVVLTMDGLLGQATGKLYAERHFPESSKQKMMSLVESVRTGYGERMDDLDWLSDTNKKYAKKKLANMKVMIGYPDEWRDFSALSITNDSYITNIKTAQKFETAYWMQRLHESPSREEWFMNAQTVNAYHDPSRVVICFPAGILQPPFFDPEASIAINLGGIGTVIGHELTHGFDDQGCMFDAEGDVRTWQTKEERAAFDAKAQIIVEQADAFEVLPGVHLQGKLVLGESIADLGGVELALHALKNDSNKSINLDEATTEFFVNFARIECGNAREEKLREAALTDPHPSNKFRVNCVLQHVDAFYESFDLSEGDALYLAPTQRARIW